MSDIKMAGEKPTIPATESHNPFVIDAYNFCTDTIAHPEARSRQAFVAAYGAAVGGIKDLPNEFINHPWETIGKVAVAGASGVAIGAALASESPAIVGVATATGIVTTTAALWHTYTKLASSEALKQSMDAVYRSGDIKTLANGMNIASDTIGPEAADYGIALAGGLVGMYGPKAFANIRYNFLANRLIPFIPKLQISPSSNALETQFKDGSILHIHGNQATYRLGGNEYALDVNGNNIDLNFLESFVGRQVLRGWRHNVHPKDNAALSERLKVDIDTIKGITKVEAAGKTTKYHHSDLVTEFPGKLTSCMECGNIRRAQKH